MDAFLIAILAIQAVPADQIMREIANQNIHQLYLRANKARWVGSVTPGGEIIVFSEPMKRLIMLGSFAREILHDRICDQRIQNEVVLVLGAIGNESTVPLLIQKHPSRAPRGQVEKLRFICFNFALCYLTAQKIGRTRQGCTLKREDREQWEGWWNKSKASFKVPREKPRASWVPHYWSEQ